ncbi:MAG: serine hydrolase [Candidatus Aminicenantes bacterium]|nr:MAG: serine hydrolase [Candidatus Aminicenantes bacterium]
MKRKLWILILLLVLPFMVFSSESSFESDFLVPFTSYPWEVSTPEEQGIHSGVLAHACNEAEKMPFLHSLLVIRNQYLIGERYFHFYDQNDANNVFSVSKSFLSALVGIALRENYLQSLDQKMLDFFPEYITPGMDPRKFDITIRHLLTMKTGYDNSVEDYGSNWRQWINSSDWLKYAIQLPLRDNPGERFAYITPGTHILSGILAKATGMSALEFAETYLFHPLGISIMNWERDPQGYYIGGMRMYFTARDMARFGYLYLNGGFVDNQQIIPGEWVTDSFTDSVHQNWTWAEVTEGGYGYLWWLYTINGIRTYCAVGYGGQYIILVPLLNMIVVTTSDGQVNAQAASRQGETIRQFIAHYILAPTKAVLDAPPYFPVSVTAKKVENRSLLQREYINVLSWQPNPNNSNVNISRYRVYQVLTNQRLFLAEVDAGTFDYMERKVDEDRLYTYGITSVTDDNKESLPIVVTVQYTTSTSQ